MTPKPPFGTQSRVEVRTTGSRNSRRRGAERSRAEEGRGGGESGDDLASRGGIGRAGIVAHERILGERAVQWRGILPPGQLMDRPYAVHLTGEAPMARRTNSSLVYLGIRGRVIALNRTTGDEI